MVFSLLQIPSFSTKASMNLRIENAWQSHISPCMAIYKITKIVRALWLAERRALDMVVWHIFRSLNVIHVNDCIEVTKASNLAQSFLSTYWLILEGLLITSGSGVGLMGVFKFAASGENGLPFLVGMFGLDQGGAEDSYRAWHSFCVRIIQQKVRSHPVEN